MTVSTTIPLHQDPLGVDVALVNIDLCLAHGEHQRAVFYAHCFVGASITYNVVETLVVRLASLSALLLARTQRSLPVA